MAENKKSFRQRVASFFRQPVSGAGNILDSALPTNNGINPTPDQAMVRYEQPYGTKVPTKLYDRTTGYSQIQNVSHEFTMQKVQGAFRAAENGDVRMLFTYYRDFILGTGIVVSELGKRKLSTISKPFSIIPASKKPEDIKAAKVIDQLLNRCSSFRNALVHMMNAVVYPIAVVEKCFEPVDDSYGSNEFGLTYKIKELHAVDYNTITYKLPYIPQSTGHSNVVGNDIIVPGQTSVVYGGVGSAQDVIYNKDSWEPDLRFWSVLPNGIIIQAPSLLISPDPERHIVYRCNLLNGIARDNFGGLGKSLLFLAIMNQLGLDVFLKCLQKYGVPFVKAQVDMQSVDTVNQIMAAFDQMAVLNAIAVNKDSIVELEEMNYSGAADAHTKFLEYIQNQISLLICGQTLSSNAQSTGLGSGVANLHAEVRDDIIQYDRLSLCDSLKHGLFRQMLDINNIPGEIPNIVWDGTNSSEDNLKLSTALRNLKQAGLEPSDESLDELSEKFGFVIQKMESSSMNTDIINQQNDDPSDIDQDPSNKDDSIDDSSNDETEKES